MKRLIILAVLLLLTACDSSRIQKIAPNQQWHALVSNKQTLYTPEDIAGRVPILSEHDEKRYKMRLPYALRIYQKTKTAKGKIIENGNLYIQYHWGSDYTLADQLLAYDGLAVVIKKGSADFDAIIDFIGKHSANIVIDAEQSPEWKWLTRQGREVKAMDAVSALQLARRADHLRIYSPMFTTNEHCVRTGIVFVMPGNSWSYLK